MIHYHVISALPKPLTTALLKKAEEVMAKALRVRTPKWIGVRFVTPTMIRSLNREYRGKDAPTDVLSFESGHEKWAALSPEAKNEAGDLVVCPAFAKKEAKKRRIDAKEELIRLLAHGTLHLFGFDHRTDQEEAKMFKIQESCVKAILLNHV